MALAALFMQLQPGTLAVLEVVSTRIVVTALTRAYVSHPQKAANLVLQSDGSPGRNAVSITSERATIALIGAKPTVLS